MRNFRLQSSTLQALTPEEPIKPSETNDTLESRSSTFPESVLQDDASPSNNAQEPFGLIPSLHSTQELKLQIMRIIEQLKSSDLQDLDKNHVADVLHKSLTAISHWSLQAQLSRLSQSKSIWDSRLMVENNLLRKEAEFFKNKFEQTETSSNTCSAQSPPVKRVTKTSNNSAYSSKRKSGSYHESQKSLKLVENTKPHPRMRRQTDNPSSNGFVRVFHLERL
ncbi:HCL055Wp [Eremothecium sinecaudum]|uniref:HCL055Wp n=1 Tax=Eremothecium sinecaudum TaxID=45286 RepID=A0A0X8HQH0_9SACH|nr:HCL055Wp [Eremothecium sinecaudum]AMD20096.1 HCL055Wp [Eremothecium sinecaudum]